MKGRFFHDIYARAAFAAELLILREACERWILFSGIRLEKPYAFSTRCLHVYNMSTWRVRVLFVKPGLKGGKLGKKNNI